MSAGDYSALALVVDRSGSMHSIANDVKGSVMNFIGEQKKQTSRATLTVVQFDDQYEIVHDFTPIEKVDETEFANAYSPRGSTALLDAIGRTTLAIEKKLEKLPEDDKPKRVVVAVITDGLENASCEFKIEQIREMIQSKEKLGWNFLFMGATLDTIQLAPLMGFSSNKSACYATSNFSSCMSVINEKVNDAREGKEVNISEAEREELVKV